MCSYSSSSDNSVIQGEDTSPRILMALWMGRLLDKNLTLTSEVITAIAYSLPSIAEILSAPLSQCATLHMNDTQKQSLECFQLADSDLFAYELSNFLKVAPLTCRLQVRKSLHEALTRVRQGLSKNFQNAREMLKEYFGLSSLACDLCELLFCINFSSEVENFLGSYLEITSRKSRHKLAQILCCTLPQLRDAYQSLCEIGLVDQWRMHLDEEMEELWIVPDRKTFDRKFYGSLPRDIYPLEEFALSDADRNHIQKLLQLPGTRPVHILLYGEAGSGKSCFVASLAAHMGLKVWVSPPSETEAPNERRASIQACSALARISSKQGVASLVVVDEADVVLDIANSFMCKGQGKAWLNTFLDQPSIRSIWIANDVSGMDESVARRFAFSVHFPTLGEQERITQWQRILQKAHMDNKVDKNVVETLAKDFHVPMGVMAHSVERCKTLYGRSSTKFLQGVRQSCTAFETLRCNGSAPNKKKEKSFDQHYNVRAVCLDSTIITVESLLHRINMADAALREGKSLSPGGYTLLFYGPPGTGKTALASYVAQELKRECDVVQASDWLDKYVGGTERNMVQSFREAQKRDAVLVIDEVDTFAFSREQAERSWEGSMINEFLTNLEKFKGICICTTNREAYMDKAAMRRFSCKVPFTWMTEAAALTLYTEVLAPMVIQETKGKRSQAAQSAEVQSGLHKLVNQRPGLALGDFRAVQASFAFAEPKECTHAVFLEALRTEVAWKGKRTTVQPMGFVRERFGQRCAKVS